MSFEMINLFEVSLHIYSNNEASEIVQKVLSCLPEIVNNDTIMSFLSNEKIIDNESMKTKFAPYKSDYSQQDSSSLKAEKDSDELSKNDRIYLELFINLGHYWKARMRSLELYRTFFAAYDGHLKKIQLLESASIQLKEAQSLHELFDVF
jgi:cytokinesis protein